MIASVMAVAALSLTAASAQEVEDNVAASREHARQKTVLSIAQVVHEIEGKKESTCGFFIDGKGTLVTVLGKNGKPGKLTVIYGEREYVPELMTYDSYTRLTLLKLDIEKSPAVKMGRSTDLAPGDYAFAVNLAKDEGADSITGRVAGREKDFMGRTLAASLIRLNMKADAGSFGAPLVSSGGAVCGIVLLGMEDGRAELCYALPAELIGKVRRDYDRHGKVVDCWLGFGMEAGTTTPEIRKLYPDSPALSAGLAEGDIIQSIGDRKVRDYQDVVDACYYLTHGDEIMFKVLRGLDDVEVRLTPAAKTVAETEAE